MNKKVLTEVKQAYIDCGTYPRGVKYGTPEYEAWWAKVVKDRNLGFVASAPVKVEEAVKIMTEALGLKTPEEEGYNSFAPALLRRLPEGTQVQLAREGSVCAYVKAPAPDAITKELSHEMLADEFHTKPDGWVRLWWD